MSLVVFLVLKVSPALFTSVDVRLVSVLGVVERDVEFFVLFVGILPFVTILLMVLELLRVSGDVGANLTPVKASQFYFCANVSKIKTLCCSD